MKKKSQTNALKNKRGALKNAGNEFLLLKKRKRKLSNLRLNFLLKNKPRRRPQKRKKRM